MNTKRLAQLEAFLKESPSDPFLLYAVAYEYLKGNDNEQALQRFVQLTQTNPDYVGTYYHLGKLQEKLQQWDTALLTYEQGMKIARKNGDHHAFNELQGAFNALNDELM